MTNKTRILILGGGFGGVSTAQSLHKIFKRDSSVEITLINRDNYFLFVPLLASAAAGSLQPLHVVVPIRQAIPGINFRAEEITDIDVERKQVTTISLTANVKRTLEYDHLVLALGNVINLSMLPGVAEHGKTIKTLGDAIAIRNHVLQMFEAADLEPDAELRQQMLTFVVAGGGFSGVEMVAEINDMVRDIISHYPSISLQQTRVMLLHSRDRILPEMSEATAGYVLKQLRKQGVEVLLNVRLASASPCEAVLQDETVIPTRTLIVAVGNAPPPVIDNLPVNKERGKIVVDSSMRVTGHSGLWALGDNAIVPNQASDTGEFSPPTAQYAIRQGATLAANIKAHVNGEELKPFAFGGLGLLCLTGHGTGVGELPFGIRLKGFLGWVMWRGVYWAKLPSASRKTHVGIDWLLGLFMQPELSQVNLARTQAVNRVHYEPGQIIFKQGEIGDFFYMILDGEVEVLHQRPNEEARVVNHHGKGVYFGETSLLTGEPRNATVRCTTAVDLIALGRDDFSVLTRSWLQLAQNVEEVSEQRRHELESD